MPEMMNSKKEILLHQRQWAEARGLHVDEKGYVQDVADNLRVGLSETALKGYDQGSGSELTSSGNKPAKMCALHSSSALVANFFDYWTDRDKLSLQEILGLDSEIDSIGYEAQFPTGLGGNPPNLDVALNLADGVVVGIESKYTEWFSKKSKSAKPFKEKYFENNSQLWAQVGLPSCQALAKSMQHGKIHFSRLDAPQLLKHALGLATQHEGSSALIYLYFDALGEESDVHREEIRIFTEALNGELGFRSVTYQEMYESLSGALGIESDFTQYIRDRYFSKTG